MATKKYNKELEVFVGIDGKWVPTEKFPEGYDKHNEMLNTLFLEGVELEVKPGFYMMSFNVVNTKEEDMYLEVDNVRQLVIH